MSDDRIESHVDDIYLVTPSKTALPQRCIVTNQPVADNLYTAWDLPFVQNWLVFFIFGPFTLFFAPLLVKRRCKLRAALSASIRRKYMLKKIGLLLIGFAPLALIPLAIYYRSDELVFLAVPGAIVSYVAAFSYVFLLKPLKAVKFNDDLFWVKGCSSEFLTSLKS